jgi:peroxiredoxin
LQKNENVKLYAISIDPPEVSKEFAVKLAADGQGEIKFLLLSAPDHRTIDAYGLRDSTYDGGKFAGIPHKGGH